MLRIYDLCAAILWVFGDDFVETYPNGLFLMIRKVFQVVVIKIVDGFVGLFSVLTLVEVQILLAFEKGCRLVVKIIANRIVQLFILWKVMRIE